MTTETGTERRNPAKPEKSQEVTPNSDELLMKDLPRPGRRVAGGKPSSPLDVGSEGPAVYNTIDLGDPGTSVDVLRPVEFGGDDTESPSLRSPQDNSTRERELPGPSEVSEARSDSAREIKVAPIPAQSAETVATDATPRTLETSAPRSSSFKASLAGGVLAPQPSTRATVQHRVPVKTEAPAKPKPWVKIAAYLGLTIVAVIVIALLVGQKPSVGTVTGVVVDAQSGRVIPSATVDLDGKRSVTTNAAGLYTFSEVSNGSYLVKASAPGYESQSGTVQAKAPQSVQLSFALAPTAGPTPAPAKPAEPVSADSTQATSSTTSSPGYGGVDLTVDFEGYLVFVDGEIYGKNAKKLKRLAIGEHRIVLQAEGFQDYTTTVTVKARVTSTVTIAKADLTPKIDPIKRSHGLFAEGKDLLDRGLWQPAIEKLDEALASDPQNADAVRYRGWCYMKSGDQVKAMDDFQKAARMYDDSKRAMEAVTCAGYMLDLKGDDAALWRQRSNYYLSLREYAKAISDIEHAIKLDKKSLENQMALGEAYFASGDYKRAAKEFDRARKMSGDPLRPYIRMILAYYNAGENDELLKKYRDFVKIAPQDLLDKLQNDPEWLPVLQMVGPEERHKN